MTVPEMSERRNVICALQARPSLNHARQAYVVIHTTVNDHLQIVDSDSTFVVSFCEVCHRQAKFRMTKNCFVALGCVVVDPEKMNIRQRAL
jgi:hypothetical protein